MKKRVREKKLKIVNFYLGFLFKEGKTNAHFKFLYSKSPSSREHETLYIRISFNTCALFTIYRKMSTVLTKYVDFLRLEEA